jgi:hypothetical protein
MREIKLDQFFTKESDAIRFINKLNELYPLSEYDFVLEPSAGSGAFFKNIKHNKVGIDLEPLCEGIQKIDFFDYEPPLFAKIAVIGNPPFGRRGSLAKKFFERCSEYADVIAFIVPAIFGKPTFYKSINKNFHLKYEEQVTSFSLLDGSEYKVNCVFQIWKKSDIQRNDVEKLTKHNDFEMIHRHISWISKEEIINLSKEYDFAYGQVSQKISDIQNLTKGSQFIIKDNTSNKIVKDVFQKMDFGYLGKYAMGAISLSRDDIITQYCIQKDTL